MQTTHEAPLAVMGGWVGTGLEEVTSDPAALDGSGRWAVAITFEGRATLARFATWEARGVRPVEVGPWRGPAPDSWASSLDEAGYRAAVEAVRTHISRGEVYQANICRILRTPIDPACDVAALLPRLAAGNPAPYAGALRLPEQGVDIASASPELFLRRSGARIESRPIKGTGATAADLLPKDEAENVMIVDLVRNDLGRICVPGSVAVPDLLALEAHPGLVHLVSTVSGELAAGVAWPEILAAAFPPGSVTGAPKLAALDIIRRLEAGPRGPYCGAFGWVDADAGTAELAVAIRTFWREDTDTGTHLAFGTGAGITWASDPGAEWRETELKAVRLLRVAGDREVT
jgi:para-aminobenzoate synthetase component 1